MIARINKMENSKQEKEKRLTLSGNAYTTAKDKTATTEMAKALGALFFFLKGTPFVYQGQELESDDKDSVLNFYKAMIQLRNHSDLMKLWCMRHNVHNAFLSQKNSLVNHQRNHIWSTFPHIKKNL